MGKITSGIRELFTWKGRIRRVRFFLIHAVAMVLCAIPYSFFSTYSMSLVYYIKTSTILTSELLFMIVISILFLVVLILGMAIILGNAIKRLHDLNWSGSWAYLLFAPVTNFILFFLLLFRRGTNGPNKYGSDPLLKKNSVESKRNRLFEIVTFAPRHLYNRFLYLKDNPYSMETVGLILFYGFLTLIEVVLFLLIINGIVSYVYGY